MKFIVDVSMYVLPRLKTLLVGLLLFILCITTYSNDFSKLNKSSVLLSTEFESQTINIDKQKSVRKKQSIVNDFYPFQAENKRRQFRALTQQLRCLVCQNESIAESGASLASDLRQQVYTMLLAGKTNQQIKEYMVARYGEFILFKPLLVERTYFLWFAPFLMLLIGCLILWKVIRKNS